MRATEFIVELFKQSTVPWVWGRRSSDEASVSFTVGQQHYRFLAYLSPSEPEVWEIEFAATSKYSNGPGKDKLKYDYDLNGAGSGALVMSTVVSIMREFLKEYNHKISSIRFSADGQSRQDLYTRMVQRLLPSWTLSKSPDSYSGDAYLLTKPSDITEEINPDILHPEFKHKQVIGDYTYTAIWNRDRELRIRCYDGRKIVGQVDFYAWSGGKTGYLASGGTEVKPEYRKKGIAYTMYAYAKMLGNDIRSGALSPDGRAMWDAWTKSGEAKHLTKEVINPDVLDQRFSHTQEINGYTYTAQLEPDRFHKKDLFVIRCYDGDKRIGQAKFYIKSDDMLASALTTVMPEYQKHGIASTMYAYAKMLGNDIKPSRNQLPPGKAMWRSWRKSGDAKFLRPSKT